MVATVTVTNSGVLLNFDEHINIPNITCSVAHYIRHSHSGDGDDDDKDNRTGDNAHTMHYDECTATVA